MQITRAADYAVRVMIHLATLPTGTRVPLKVLANAIGVPEHFLAKLLQSLTRAEFMVSRRGPDGGFELTSSARAATMLDVIQVIEGPLELNACLGDTGCNRRTFCPANMVWKQAQEALVNVLGEPTIAELAAVSVRLRETAELATV